MNHTPQKEENLQKNLLEQFDPILIMPTAEYHNILRKLSTCEHKMFGGATQTYWVWTLTCTALISALVSCRTLQIWPSQEHDSCYPSGI